MATVPTTRGDGGVTGFRHCPSLSRSPGPRQTRGRPDADEPPGPTPRQDLSSATLAGQHRVDASVPGSTRRPGPDPAFLHPVSPLHPAVSQGAAAPTDAKSWQLLQSPGGPHGPLPSRGAGTHPSPPAGTPSALAPAASPAPILLHEASCSESPPSENQGEAATLGLSAPGTPACSRRP